ncbi:MAG TPA: 30S ribosomal protein S20, partial [Cyclobacteriaceae bacterium]|nr:30S ribosomal protein S20 [Cyclobacteriaceae bacterium]
KRVRNRYQNKSTRTQIKKLETTTSKTEAQALLNEVSAMIDKLAKNNVIHWKKAANQKSRLAKKVNALA